MYANIYKPSCSMASIGNVECGKRGGGGHAAYAPSQTSLPPPPPPAFCLQPAGPAPAMDQDYGGWVNAQKRKWRAARSDLAAKRRRTVDAAKAAAAAARAGRGAQGAKRVALTHKHTFVMTVVPTMRTAATPPRA